MPLNAAFGGLHTAAGFCYAEVQEYCKFLGIELPREEHLSWIAVEGLKVRSQGATFRVWGGVGVVFF